MSERVKEISLANVVDDLKERTLASISGQVARLVYLASTRDYISGRYLHEGLERRFSAKLAERAIELCHREEFDKLAVSSLSDLIDALDSFLRSARSAVDESLRTWKTLEPYRVLVPQHCDVIAKELFFSNMRIALFVLEARLLNQAQSRQCALQQQ
jgi:hypothetical protein